MLQSTKAAGQPESPGGLTLTRGNGGACDWLQLWPCLHAGRLCTCGHPCSAVCSTARLQATGAGDPGDVINQRCEFVETAVAYKTKPWNPWCPQQGSINICLFLLGSGMPFCHKSHCFNCPWELFVSVLGGGTTVSLSGLNPVNFIRSKF